MDKQIIAFDVETHLFGPRNMAPQVVCLSWATGEKFGIIVGEDSIVAWLIDHLDRAASGRAILVGHYVAFDCSCIMVSYEPLSRLVWKAYEADGLVCTAIRERLLDIATGEFPYPISADGDKTKSTYSLADISRIRLGRKVKKGEDTWRLRYGELDGVPLSEWPKAAVDYSVQDAELVLQLYINQLARASQLDYSMPSQFDDSRADFALRLMSVWGILVDVPRVERVWGETVERMIELADDLEFAGLVKWTKQSGDLLSPGRRQPPDVRKSMEAVREMIAETYPGKVPRTDKGAISTSGAVLAECNCEALEKLAEFNGLQKQASTYFDKLFEPIIHARFNAVGAASGRTTCSQPNLQNQPKIPGMRECFVPAKHNVFLACDFDSQEMRTLAQCAFDICGRSRLAENYRRDRHYDPHLEFASKLAKISAADAASLLAKKDQQMKFLRQQAKVCNFGFPGGMGVNKFVDYAGGWGIDISFTRAEELKRLWFEQWPEMAIYFDHVRNVVGTEGAGVIRLPQGGFMRGDCGYSDTANTYFQTLAAHASKSALWEVSRRCYTEPTSALYGSRPVLFVHDEIVTETPEFAGHEAALEIERVMVEQMERWTPNVPSSASATLMRCWSKAAERVIDRGRLVAWQES